MVKGLEGKIEGKTILLDSSFFTPQYSLCRELYRGFGGINQIPQQALEENAQRVKDINLLADTGKLVVIGEALSEVRSYYKNLDSHVSYLRGFQQTRDSQRSDIQTAKRIEEIGEYVDKLYSLVSRLDSPQFRIGFQGEENGEFARLESLIAEERGNFLNFLRNGPDKEMREKRTRFFQRLLDNKGRVVAMDQEHYKGDFKVDFVSYYGYLKMAMHRSLDQKRSRIDHALRISKPSCNGLLLDTQSKIVAAGFAMSYLQPALILSRTESIKYTVERVKEFVRSGEGRRYGIVNHSRNSLEFLNIDYKEDFNLRKDRISSKYQR